MTRIQWLAGDLVLIDTHYGGRPEAIGAYLQLGPRPALLETGPAATVETMLAGVREAGLNPAALQAIAVTHIHLDHAGAVGILVQRFPHLEVYVHPVGAPHLVDPSRLLASASRLFGDGMKFLGEALPVPAERIHTLEDGTALTLGSRRLVALDTPGHARHHLVYLDEQTGDLFTGDAAGVALPGSRYVRPPTPPPELDIPAWQATLERLRSLRPRRLLLTHFGPHMWADDLLRQMRDRLRALEAIAVEAADAGLDDDAMVERFRRAVIDEIRAAAGEEEAARLELITATQLNALGLLRYVRTRRPG